MAGIGGVFPNFEDHLLDKKKISEFYIKSPTKEKMLFSHVGDLG